MTSLTTPYSSPDTKHEEATSDGVSVGLCDVSQALEVYERSSGGVAGGVVRGGGGAVEIGVEAGDEDHMTAQCRCSYTYDR